jgi:hypothetical protein
VPKDKPTRGLGPFRKNPNFFGLDLKLFSEVQMDSKRGLGLKAVAHHAPQPNPKIFTFSPAAASAESPCSVAAFEVNSESHTGARPSVRFCVGLIKLNT